MSDLRAVELDKLTVLPGEALPTETRPCPRDDLPALYRLCQRLEALCITHDGIGLSAAQVGLPYKLFVVRRPQAGETKYFLDAEYEPAPQADKVRSVEGCLSIKDADGKFRFFRVERPGRVLVRATELVAGDALELVPYSATLTGLYATVFQHEIDHQNGVLISGIGTEMHIW